MRFLATRLSPGCHCRNHTGKKVTSDESVRLGCVWDLRNVEKIGGVIVSILIRGVSMPKSCYECKLDLRSDVCAAFCEWNAEHPYSIRATDRLPDCPLSEVPECEDAVPRTSIEYICKKNTVSTNPYEHKYHDKFIQFMDDPEISDFGRWQWSNGFNTALTAVGIDLKKLPSAQPEIIRCKDCKYWREHKYFRVTKGYVPFCGFNAIYTKADDFCSRAERRTDEDD